MVALKELRVAMDTRENLLEVLDKARELSIHYAEKGDLLYPILKLKYNFKGPTDIMWTVDDENSVNRYFNDGDDMKLFKRPLMAIDREVFSCHPPKI